MTTPATLIRRVQAAKVRKAAEQTGASLPAPDAQSNPDSGFAGVPHRRSGGRAGTLALRLLVGLLLVAGAWSLFGRPLVAALHTPPPVTPPPTVIDAGAAGRVAAGFTYGYLSYDGSAAAGSTSVTESRWTAAGLPGWTGTATLTPDQVFTGQIVDDGPDRAIVQTSALVTPSGGVKPTWLDLAVVVVRDGAGLRVTTATLDGDVPAAVRAPGQQIDSSLSVSTASTAKDLLGALATGKTSYVTTPNVQLAGLSGAVQLVDLSAWSVSQAGGDTRYAHTTVTWQLTGTDLKVQQPLALRIKNVDGRWLLDSYGPALEG